MTHELPVPVDVRLMNLTTSLLVTALVLGCVIAGLWWAIRNPAFAFTQITVGGDTAHHSAASPSTGHTARTCVACQEVRTGKSPIRLCQTKASAVMSP